MCNPVGRGWASLRVLHTRWPPRSELPKRAEILGKASHKPHLHPIRPRTPPSLSSASVLSAFVSFLLSWGLRGTTGPTRAALLAAFKTS